MQDSVTRMSGLIDSVLDFARGRLGGGVALERVSSDPLVPLLDLIVAGLRTAWPDRTYDHFFACPELTLRRSKATRLSPSAIGTAMSLRRLFQPWES